MNKLVECHCGSAYAEKPTALTWLGSRQNITEILTQWRTPQAKWFRVRTTDGQDFELAWNEATGEQASEEDWIIRPI